MKHLKLFEEMNIVDGKDFPLSGNRLSPRERKILTDLIDNEYLNFFTIRVEDHYYYSVYRANYNVFDNFNELKYYLLSRYYIAYNKSDLEDLGGGPFPAAGVAGERNRQ